MTLIAAVVSDRTFPILAADLLVSSPIAPRQPGALPLSARYAGLLQANGQYVVGPRRKTHLFSGQLCLAVAGSMLVATSIIRRLVDNNTDAADVEAAIIEYISEYSPEERNVSFIGIKMPPTDNDKGPGPFQIIGYNSRAMHNVNGFKAVYDGSGGDFFRETFTQHSKGFLRRSSISHSLFGNLPFLGSLALSQSNEADRGPRIEMFGGGYELISPAFIDGKFSLAYIDKVAYVFCNMNFDKEGDFEAAFTGPIVYVRSSPEKSIFFSSLMNGERVERRLINILTNISFRGTHNEEEADRLEKDALLLCESIAYITIAVFRIKTPSGPMKSYFVDLGGQILSLEHGTERMRLKYKTDLFDIIRKQVMNRSKKSEYAPPDFQHFASGK